MRSCRRIIPARAGFTGRASSSRSGMPDHPRACGVYPRECQWGRWRPGSSPRVRGLLGGRHQADLGCRIIPARAGFTRVSASGAAGGPDHPRACGVYAGAPDCVLPPQGSSPRVRGLPERLSVVVLLPRIIPARAGFTRGSRSTLACPADHPRACGVYAWDAKVPGDILGSSPRVRGLRVGREGARGHPGIIPARAGFTR